MSLLSNRSLQLHIGALSVRGTLRAKRAAPAVLARSHRPFRPAATLAPTAAIGKPCLAAMDDVLQELATGSGRRKPGLHVALGDAGVHFDVVHGDYSGASDRQLQAVAHACVAEVLGAAAAGQLVRWQLQPDLRHLLIASVDLRDVASVTQAAARHGLQLQSLQPDLCLQWNHHASALPACDCVFATLHEDYASVAYAQAGAITALSCGPCLSPAPTAPATAPKVHPVDARADRLLAGLGLDGSAVARFMLVTSAPESGPFTARWTALHPAEGLQ